MVAISDTGGDFTTAKWPNYEGTSSSFTSKQQAAILTRGELYAIADGIARKMTAIVEMTHPACDHWVFFPNGSACLLED